VKVNFLSNVGTRPVQIEPQHTKLSPFYFFVCDLVPAVFADGQDFVLVEDVKLNLTVAAFAVPRIPASFSHGSFTLGDSAFQPCFEI
jgi:hypothetical protein